MFFFVCLAFKDPKQPLVINRHNASWTLNNSFHYKGLFTLNPHFLAKQTCGSTLKIVLTPLSSFKAFKYSMFIWLFSTGRCIDNS